MSDKSRLLPAGRGRPDMPVGGTMNCDSTGNAVGSLLVGHDEEQVRWAGHQRSP
jgi:hypothetical protein